MLCLGSFIQSLSHEWMAMVSSNLFLGIVRVGQSGQTLHHHQTVENRIENPVLKYCDRIKIHTQKVIDYS